MRLQRLLQTFSGRDYLSALPPLPLMCVDISFCGENESMAYVLVRDNSRIE